MVFECSRQVYAMHSALLTDKLLLLTKSIPGNDPLKEYFLSIKTQNVQDKVNSIV